MFVAPRGAPPASLPVLVADSTPSPWPRLASPAPRGVPPPCVSLASVVAHAVEEKVGGEGLVLVACDPRLVVSSG